MEVSKEEDPVETQGIGRKVAEGCNRIAKYQKLAYGSKIWG
jgi:hypothetical protein